MISIGSSLIDVRLKFKSSLSSSEEVQDVTCSKLSILLSYAIAFVECDLNFKAETRTQDKRIAEGFVIRTEFIKSEFRDN